MPDRWMFQRTGDIISLLMLSVWSKEQVYFIVIA